MVMILQRVKTELKVLFEASTACIVRVTGLPHSTARSYLGAKFEFASVARCQLHSILVEPFILVPFVRWIPQGKIVVRIPIGFPTGLLVRRLRIKRAWHAQAKKKNQEGDPFHVQIVRRKISAHKLVATFSPQCSGITRTFLQARSQPYYGTGYD
jgi:hypothetical protein